MQGNRLTILRWPAAMVLTGLSLRVLYILVTHCYRFGPEHWSTFEMATLGHSLASGRGFALAEGAGPSAWTAPVYPYLIALAFLIFGVFSPAAAFALLLVNSVFAALTSWTIYRIARRLFTESVAVWSGWIWVLLPSSIYFAVYWFWETTLSAFLLSLLFLLTLQMANENRPLFWCGYGFLWGLIALINTSAVAWLPFAGCWLVYQLRCRQRPYLRAVVLGSVVFWLTLTPWLVRNYVVFGEPLVRGDFGVELRAGNNPQAQGWWVATYTYNNPVLARQYRSMGESAYVAEQGREARKWIAENPHRFLVVSLRRFVFFWAGIPHHGIAKIENVFSLAFSLLAVTGLVLACKRRIQGSFLFLSLLLFYPMVYYVTFPTPRYRHIIEPEMLMLAVSILAWGKARFLPQKSNPASVAGKTYAPVSGT